VPVRDSREGHFSLPTMPALIVVSGPPGAGKSTLATALRSALGWPLLAKDDYKERLFDVLGWSDREWSKRLSLAAYATLFATARELLAVGQSCIVEGNFRWEEQQANFAQLPGDSQLALLQVFVTARPETLIARFDARSTQRHPGHVDAASRDEIVRELRSGSASPLPLPGELFVFETDELTSEGVREMVERVSAWARDTR
jgi:predicted kinase